MGSERVPGNWNAWSPWRRPTKRLWTCPEQVHGGPGRPGGRGGYPSDVLERAQKEALEGLETLEGLEPLQNLEAQEESLEEELERGGSGRCPERGPGGSVRPGRPKGASGCAQNEALAALEGLEALDGSKERKMRFFLLIRQKSYRILEP